MLTLKASYISHYPDRLFTTSSTILNNNDGQRRVSNCFQTIYLSLTVPRLYLRFPQKMRIHNLAISKGEITADFKLRPAQVPLVCGYTQNKRLDNSLCCKTISKICNSVFRVSCFPGIMNGILLFMKTPRKVQRNHITRIISLYFSVFIFIYKECTSYIVR